MSGTSLPTCSATPVDGGRTRIGYHIDLAIRSAFIRFLARFLPVTAMHDKLIGQILGRLGQRLEAQQKAEKKK